MKKILTILISTLLICLIIIFTALKSQSSPTITEALQKRGIKVHTIVNEKDVDGGKVIVFTQKDISDKGFTLYSEYVKKTLFGWKSIDGERGGHGGNEQISSGYFKFDNKIRLTTGYVADSDILKVNVEIDDNIVNPEMIMINNVRLWVLYIENSIDPMKINVIGKTKKGNIVRNIDLTRFISLTSN